MFCLRPDNGCELYVNGSWVYKWPHNTPQAIGALIVFLKDICKPIGFQLMIVQEDGMADLFNDGPEDAPKDELLERFAALARDYPDGILASKPTEAEERLEEINSCGKDFPV
jgi:hypothetical protein